MRRFAFLVVAVLAACSSSGGGAGDVQGDPGPDLPLVLGDNGTDPGSSDAPDAGADVPVAADGVSEAGTDPAPELPGDVAVEAGADDAGDDVPLDTPAVDTPPDDGATDTAGDAEPTDIPADVPPADIPTDVQPPDGTPVLSFNADFTETLSGPIVQGRKLVLHYDWNRLPTCRGTHNGCPAWALELLYAFDLAVPATTVSVVSHNCDSTQADPVIDIPANATDVWLWAHNANTIESCETWDSNFGANYRFPVFAAATIARDVAWAGNLDFVFVHTARETSNGDVDPAYFFATMLGIETAVAIRAQAYVQGITDRVYQDAAVTGAVGAVALKPSVVTDLWGQGPAGQAKASAPLTFAGTVGNNFVYEWRVGFYGYFPPDSQPADGAYSYRMRFQTAEGSNALDLGLGLAGEGDRTIVYSQKPECALFPKNPPAAYCR